MLKQRDDIHSALSISRTSTSSDSSLSNGNSSSSKVPGEDSPWEEGSSAGKDKSAKKRWFNLNLKGSDKKLG